MKFYENCKFILTSAQNKINFYKLSCLYNKLLDLAYLHTLWVAFACSCRIYMPPIKCILRYVALHIKCIRTSRPVCRAGAFFARQKARWTYSKGNPTKYPEWRGRKKFKAKSRYTCCLRWRNGITTTPTNALQNSSLKFRQARIYLHVFIFYRLK